MITTPHKRTLKSRQAGATLIEILVSVLVIALGLLTMASVQSNSVKFQKTSEFRAIATLLASDLADRMRANQLGVEAQGYSVPSESFSDGLLTANNEGAKQACGAIVNGKVEKCTPEQMAAQDLFEWRSRLRASLPNAAVHVSQYNTAQRAVELWIAWVDAADKDSGGDSKSPRSAECPPTTVWGSDVKDPSEFHCVFLRVAL
ncbi:type IV pilus modification protein PilV [Aquabacterium sp. NJ1]|uniref:type IV pilus modification protein PilV n=1 Tax=Aquabacterium sp. NJ1 TaxID=1538295 RepID=UPI00068994CB|nr:type IV pilus modification protein PilV [Aquabacterium sp. NJ1]